jgi:hypothetical protein
MCTRTLGLQQAPQNGFYTCCQIAQWADEQWLAWLEAAQEDGKHVDDVSWPTEFGRGKAIVVPVRFRPPHVP